MQSFKLTAHVVLTTLDYERLRIGLKIAPGYPIYVIYNSVPREMHLTTAKKIELKTLEILRELGFVESRQFDAVVAAIDARYKSDPPTPLPAACDTDQLKFIPLNFYHFEDALIDLFGLFYAEGCKGSQLVVNISGGTKPATIAATFAAALTMNATPIYFVGEKWSEEGGPEVVPEYVMKQPIPIGPLFDLRNILPSGEENTNIFLSLKSGPVGTIGELLERIDITPSKKLIAKYSYYLYKLSANNAVDMGREQIGLTDVGKLIARLVEKKQAVDVDAKKTEK